MTFARGSIMKNKLLVFLVTFCMFFCPCIFHTATLNAGDLSNESDQGVKAQSAIYLLLLPSPTCADGVKNGTETDVDCGGLSCPPCAAGHVCNVILDCSSHICTSHICQ